MFVELAKSDPLCNNRPSVAKRCKKIHKHAFSADEDMIIKCKVAEYGTKNWKAVASFLPTRTVRQVRERWKSYLDPKVINAKWTEEEDELLLSLIDVYGTKWASISKHFNGRTNINVKNRMALLQRKKARESTYADNNISLENSLYTEGKPTSNVIEQIIKGEHLAFEEFDLTNSYDQIYFLI